jgi:ribosomal-protein-alanine N-acetyltransferase
MASAEASARAPAGAPGFDVRAATDADVARIVEIEQACFSVPWTAATFRGLIRRTDSDLLVAEVSGDVVGYAACWTVLDQAELGNVAVAAEARGRGIGGALVDAVVDRVRERGAAECYLEVRESNLEAQAIYGHRGFAVVGRRRGYYSLPVEDALVMRLRIALFA